MPAPLAPSPKMPWEEAKDSNLMPWEEAKQGKAETPPTFGEQFRTRLGDNVVNLGGLLTDPLGTLAGMAEPALNPSRYIYETGKRMLTQPPAETAADLAFGAGVAEIPVGLGKLGGGVVKRGVRSTLKAAVEKPPEPKITAIPMNILRQMAVEKGWFQEPEPPPAPPAGPMSTWSTPTGIMPTPVETFTEAHPYKVSAPPTPKTKPAGPAPKAPPPVTYPNRTPEPATPEGTPEAQGLTPAPIQTAPPGPVPGGSVTRENLVTIQKLAETTGDHPVKILSRWVHEAATDAWGASKTLHHKLSEHLKQRYGVSSMTELSEQQLLDEYHALKNIAAQKKSIKPEQ